MQERMCSDKELTGWLNVDAWMSPEMCLPDVWFRWFVIIGASYVALHYFLFSYQVLARLRAKLNHLVDRDFGTSLGWVFVLCGALHAAHGWAYYHQYFKLIAFSYPLLCYMHTRLLRSAMRGADNIDSLKNEEDISAMRHEYQRCKYENATLRTTIREARIHRDLSKLNTLYSLTKKIE